MVIGLLAITSIPTITGTALGVSEQRKANERKNDARRMAKFYIDVECSGEMREDGEVHGRRVVLWDNKVYLEHSPSRETHTPTCFYIEYPEIEETKHLKRGLGLVTSTSDNPPMLGWIYADKETHELKYGNRSQSIEHVAGPWDWTADDGERTVTLERKKGFVAVLEDDGDGDGVGDGGAAWRVYFDRDGDELEGVLGRIGKLDNAFMPVALERTLVEPDG